MCIDDEQFSVPRATQSNTKLVELQSRSFVGPFVASIASFSRNARTKTRLGIKVKVRARFNLDLGGRRGRGRAIKAECTAHCCAEHCRCAGAKPSNTRPVIGIPTRYLEGLIAASAFPNFIEISSYWSRMRIFRDENFFDANAERDRRRRGRLRKGKSSFRWREGLIRAADTSRRSILEAKGLDSSRWLCKGCSGHVNLSWFEWRVSTVTRPGQLLVTWCNWPRT